jgi:predicted Rdx family selenoprotein
VFEVTIGNELIFSKKQTGRFPMPGEVETALEQRDAAG